MRLVEDHDQMVLQQDVTGAGGDVDPAASFYRSQRGAYDFILVVKYQFGERAENEDHEGETNRGDTAESHAWRGGFSRSPLDDLR